MDRLSKVYYGSNWASDESKGAIADEYNEVMHEISRKQYVYLSWLQRYWDKDKAKAFACIMEKIRILKAYPLFESTQVTIRYGEPGAAQRRLRV